MKNLSTDKAFPVLLSGRRCLNDKDYEKLCRCVVSLVVRYSIIANQNPSVLEDTLYDTARFIREAKSKKVSSAKILVQAKQRLKLIDPSKTQIRQGLEHVFLKKPQAQYLLVEIGNKLQSPTKAVALEKISIEHIFPAKAKKSQWSGFDELRPLLWHIGNLTLIEPAINVAVGNEAFSKKRGEYGKSKIEMTKSIAKNSMTWSVDAVIDRARGLSKLVDQVWQVQ